MAAVISCQETVSSGRGDGSHRPSPWEGHGVHLQLNFRDLATGANSNPTGRHKVQHQLLLPPLPSLERKYRPKH